MYMSITTFYLYLHLGIIFILSCAIIGTASWCWIDDKGYPGIMYPLGNYLDSNLLRVCDNIALEVLWMCILLIFSPVFAISWPLWFGIVGITITRYYRRQRKLEAEKGGDIIDS